jgi:hypothetical protein
VIPKLPIQNAVLINIVIPDFPRVSHGTLTACGYGTVIPVLEILFACPPPYKFKKHHTNIFVR